MTELLRVLMKAKDNGQEYPVYVQSREEADDAARTLQSDIVSMQPATAAGLHVEQLTTLLTTAMGYRQPQARSRWTCVECGEPLPSPTPDPFRCPACR